jgi:mono/diheme cytochrome c family protein
MLSRVPPPRAAGFTPAVRTAGMNPAARCLLILLLLALPACQQRMGDQPSYKPLEPSDFFADGRASRPVIAGTVARGQLHDDPVLYAGRDDQGDLSADYPFEMTKDVLTRGRQRYDIYCSVCHGLTGHGDGRIVQRGFTKPPNYVTDDSRGYKLRGETKKLTDVPPGYVFEVITKGYGAMPDHASQIPVRDRWAIVGYVKALQYSQSPELRAKMKADQEKGAKK